MGAGAEQAEGAGADLASEGMGAVEGFAGEGEGEGGEGAGCGFCV